MDIFEMSVKKRERCLQEVQLLGNLRHPAIIEMLDSFLDDNVLIIVFEWAAGGDLKRLLRQHLAQGRLIEEAAVWAHFHEIVDAVAYMHATRVMHRDVKPANVLVTGHGRGGVAAAAAGAPGPCTADSPTFSQLSAQLAPAGVYLCRATCNHRSHSRHSTGPLLRCSS